MDKAIISVAFLVVALLFVFLFLSSSKQNSITSQYDLAGTIIDFKTQKNTKDSNLSKLQLGSNLTGQLGVFVAKFFKK